jgi:hypothetical protein
MQKSVIFLLCILLPAILCQDFQAEDQVEQQGQQIQENVDPYDIHGHCRAGIIKLLNPIKQFESVTKNSRDRSLLSAQGERLFEQVDAARKECELNLSPNGLNLDATQCDNDASILHLLNQAFISDGHTAPIHSLKGRLTNLYNYSYKLKNDCQ